MTNNTTQSQKAELMDLLRNRGLQPIEGQKSTKSGTNYSSVSQPTKVLVVK
ncbi:hypothetical protein BBR01nite_04750 [Brevibacillus brevis]|nr:hypothetical protein BBR01nite_04750 [Brevibacillus brevis]